METATNTYEYQKLIEAEKLNMSELPEDARIAIKDIAKAERGIQMAEAKGRNTDVAKKKLKALDKWATLEIKAHVDGKKSANPAPAPKADEILADIKDDKKGEPVAQPVTPANKDDKKDDKKEEPKVDPRGLSIEAELKKLFDSGTKEWNLDAIKSSAPQAYDDIFNDYKEGGENGVATSRYSLIETSPKIFTIKKI